MPFCSNWWSGPLGPVIAGVTRQHRAGPHIVPMRVRNLLVLLNLGVLPLGPG